MGVVLQEAYLFNTSIAENIRLGKLDATDEEIAAAARTAEIHGFISELPYGYQTLAGEHGGLFSGGQRQRINASLCRAESSRSRGNRVNIYGHSFSSCSDGGASML